jgi:hypothetical protein
MSFKEYLTSKKIDSDAYKAAEPGQWFNFSTIFEQMHPKSFTLQKLNLINGIRRRFPYIEEIAEKDQVKSKTVRPMIKPKTQPATGISSEADNKPVRKPKMAKPVLKPKMGKPVMKPKVKSDPAEGNKKEDKPNPVIKPKMAKPVLKPKMGKPVMKPKIKTDLTDNNNKEDKPKPVIKPKMARPVMKSKPKKSTD